jgi:hypothetical protein
MKGKRVKREGEGPGSGGDRGGKGGGVFMERGQAIGQTKVSVGFGQAVDSFVATYFAVATDPVEVNRKGC